MMNADRRYVSALVLAAGRGARMGRTKQLLPMGGRPLLALVIDAALGSVADEVVVVLGHEAGEIRSALADGWTGRLRFVENVDYERGQSSSLVAGIAAVDPRSEAVVVLLGDQPTVSSADIDRVIEASTRDGVVAVRAMYDEGAAAVAGHPTLIGRALWDEVRGVRGDKGARDVLARHGDHVLRVQIGKPPPADVDTPGDYELLVAATNRRREIRSDVRPGPRRR